MPVDGVYIKNMSKIFSGQTSVIEVNAHATICTVFSHI